MKQRRKSRIYKSASHANASKQESKQVKVLGGEAVRGSGCGFDKADTKIKDVLRLECKSTINKSFSVTKKILDKVNNACMGTEIPAVHVELVNKDSGDVTDACYIIPVWAMEILINNQK